MDDDEELPALDPQPEEQDDIDWVEHERFARAMAALPTLAAQPATARPQQGPRGAQTYDAAAARLGALRSGNMDPNWAGTDMAKQMGAQVWGFDPNSPSQRQADLATRYNGAPPQAPVPAGGGASMSELSARYDVAAPPVGAPAAAPQQVPAQSDYDARMAAWMQQLQQSRAAQEQDINASYEKSRPSESEKWLAIAAALASPTQHGSFGEVMGNVFQSLLGYKQGVRGAESTRQAQLAKLRQAYDIAGINAAAKGLKPPTPVRLAVNPVTGETQDPYTGKVLKQPSDMAWQALQSNPTDANLSGFLREFPQYTEQATAVVSKARTQQGGM